jgi:hypothetical protein
MKFTSLARELMFNSTSKCPVEPKAREWIEHRMHWLTQQFGLNKLRSTQIVLPRAKFFPDGFDGSDESVRALLNRVCNYMGITGETIHLSFYEERPPVETDGLVEGTAGLYVEEGGAFRIWLEVKNLDDPLALVATMAHELGHVLLLGHGRISADVEDHEPLTDLLTVFLGLGVITANSVVRETSWSAGVWSGWSVGRRGYLTMQMYGYALALFAHLRDETRPDWAKHLRPDVRAAFKLSQLWIANEGSLPRTAGPKSPFDDPPNQEGHTVESAEAEQDSETPRCSFCGSSSDVADTDSGQMCSECRDSVVTNLEALVEEGEGDAIGIYGRTMVRTLAIIIAIAFLFLIGRWIVLSIWK